MIFCTPGSYLLPSTSLLHYFGVCCAVQFVLDETRVVPVTSEPIAGAKVSDPSALTELPTLASGLSAVSGLSSLSALSAVSAGSEPIVPCPRRFGATFSPGGTLVVFSSSLAVILARPPRPDDTRKHRTRGSSQVITPPPPLSIAGQTKIRLICRRSLLCTTHPAPEGSFHLQK